MFARETDTNASTAREGGGYASLPLVPSAPPLAPWSAPPAPTAFTSTPPTSDAMPSWWRFGVRYVLAATLLVMAAKAALLFGVVRL